MSQIRIVRDYPHPPADLRAQGLQGHRRLPAAKAGLEEDLWNGAPAEAICTLKKEAGPDLAIMGSGTIVSQLTAARLIDEYQFVITPSILGKGRTLFESVQDKVNLKMVGSRTFKNGNVYLRYQPA
jgi:dihydrofolate reductase